MIYKIFRILGIMVFVFTEGVQTDRWGTLCRYFRPVILDI